MGLQGTHGSALIRLSSLQGKALMVAWAVVTCAGAKAQWGTQDLGRLGSFEERDELRVPTDESLVRRIDYAIAALGSPDYPVREEASETLRGIGPEAFAQLCQAYNHADDFEVRTRIAGVVREAFLDFFVFYRYGFLGIQQGPRPGWRPIGVEIVNVIPGTGAERAGLRRGDHIVGVDGRMFENLREIQPQNFGQVIRERGSGGTISVIVERGHASFEVTATLGRPPENLIENSGLPGLRDSYYRSLTRFAAFWQFHFESPSTVSGTH